MQRPAAARPGGHAPEDPATNDKIIVAQGQLLDPAEKLIAGGMGLRALAEDEAGVCNTRVERITAETDKRTRWLGYHRNALAVAALSGAAGGAAIGVGSRPRRPSALSACTIVGLRGLP